MTNRGSRFARYTYKGETYTLTGLSELSGIPTQTLNSRLRLDWPMDKVMTTPVKHRTPGDHPGRTIPGDYLDTLAKAFLYRKAI